MRNHPVCERDVDRDLWERVCAEYLEMPGLDLTVSQACRLWTTNVEISRQVLDSLVEDAFLRRCGDRYVRRDSAKG